MGRYDEAQGSTDYQDRLPGIGAFDARSRTAPGTGGVGFERNDLGTLGDPIITTPGASTTAEPQPTVRVDAGDTEVPSQTDSLGPAGLCASGLSAGHPMDETGAGRGKPRQASAADHPNSLGTGP